MLLRVHPTLLRLLVTGPFRLRSGGVVAGVADRVLGLSEVLAAEAQKETVKKFFPRKPDRRCSGLARLCFDGFFYLASSINPFSRVASPATIENMVNVSLFCYVSSSYLLDPTSSRGVGLDDRFICLIH